MSSGQVEQALDAVWARTRGARNRRRIQEELADHLYEATASEVARGLDSEDAARRAVERFGDAKTIAAAFPASRWRIATALAALGTMSVLVWAEVATHQASIRTCAGGRCPIWIPRAPQHPIHERVELVTAAAAATLAVIMGLGAVIRWRRAEHGYEAAIERTAAEPLGLTTRALLVESLRGPLCVAILGLALMTITGAGLAARWQTEGPPASPTVVALRPTVLEPHRTTIDGLSRARPLLQGILGQLPGDFISVGVHPGRGLVIQTRATSDPAAHASDPTQVISRVETDALLEAFMAYQGAYGLHITRYQVMDGYPDDTDAGTLSARFGRTPVPPVVPIPHLRTEIAAKLGGLGLHITTVTITHPNGPFVIAVARTNNPRHYIERSPGPLSRHIAWGVLVIRDQSGTARAIYVTQSHHRYTEVWYDPRLYPAQPDPVGQLAPESPTPTPHASPRRAPRT